MLFRIVKIVRSLLNLPLYLVLKFGSFYSTLIKFYDYRNHEVYWEDKLRESLEKRKSKIIKISKNKSIQFYTPSTITSYRAKTFFSKEPDTISWLNNTGHSGKILYDIGANIGNYSIYFSKKFNSISYAFEPSFSNLVLLQKNIVLNKLNDKIILIPNPLYRKSLIANLVQMRVNDPGFAGTTFKDKKIQKLFLKKNKKNFFFNTNVLSNSLDELVGNKLLKKPNLIKIDVDGNEVDIIAGAKKLLKNNKISLLIEIQKFNFDKVSFILNKLGYKNVSYRRNNYIWEN